MSRLMISISGIRGVVGEGLSPELVARYAAAFGEYCGGGPVVLGRDTRPSGPLMRHAVIAGLCGAGCRVLDVGVVPTPTVAVLVEELGAAGGICITASHNPVEWNALKFFHHDGLFLDPEQSRQHLALAERGPALVRWDKLGGVECLPQAPEAHVRRIKALGLLDVPALRKRGFRVAVDCVNGAGRTMVPHLLQELGCEVVKLGVEDTGLFSRGPEPTPENLAALCETMRGGSFDVGFALDPDADRLALVDAAGVPLGEELTLALVARHVLGHQPSPLVANVSSSQLLDDVAREAGVDLHRTRVGEINVSVRMRELGSAIGGEGNGGVILRDLHLGRDAPVGIALLLQYLLESGRSLRELRDELPVYAMLKEKIELGEMDPVRALERVRDALPGATLDETDGLKFLLEQDGGPAWVQVRASNTEPILRVFAEAVSPAAARGLVERLSASLRG
ncbi:MAG: phosphoglucosamine mutase [Candidatus Delongbacteria bacterium]